MLGRDGSEPRPHTTHGDARARTLAPTSLCSPPRYNCRTMADWARRLRLSREALINSARTAVATVASLLLARSLKLPEFYWAPISTIVILLSTINPLTLAWQRFAGTALGAALGALIATFFSSNWIVYGAGIFVCGIVCSFLRVGSAYRFAAITLSIVLLVAHERPPWIVASHRFVEVSLGIAVALLTAEVWRVPGTEVGQIEESLLFLLLGFDALLNELYQDAVVAQAAALREPINLPGDLNWKAHATTDVFACRHGTSIHHCGA